MKRAAVLAFMLLASPHASAADFYRSLGFNILSLDKIYTCITDTGRHCKAKQNGMTTHVAAKSDGDVFRVEFWFDKSCNDCIARLAQWMKTSTNLDEPDIIAVLAVVKATAEKQPLPLPPTGIVVETGQINDLWFLKVTGITFDTWETRKRLRML